MVPPSDASVLEKMHAEQKKAFAVISNDFFSLMNILVLTSWFSIYHEKRSFFPLRNAFLKLAILSATSLIIPVDFQKDHVLLLLNEKATRRNIMAAFGDTFLPAVTRDGDLVAIYISTHGTPANKDPGKRNFIVAYDTEGDALYETGVDIIQTSCA